MNTKIQVNSRFGIVVVTVLTLQTACVRQPDFSGKALEFEAKAFAQSITNPTHADVQALVNMGVRVTGSSVMGK